MEVWQMGYYVARNSLGTVPNPALASDPGKEFFPPILSILVMQGFKIKRERISTANLILLI